MIISLPAPAHANPSAARSRAEPPLELPVPNSSWRYDRRRRPRTMLVLATGISVALHAGLLLGVGSAPKKVPVTPAAEIPTIRLTIPEAKELEETEPVADDDRAAVTELSTLVPMQADRPQIPYPSDFVQQVDFSTLIERPDFSQMKMFSIPESFRGGDTGKIAQNIGAIFNLADLDRIPEVVLQTPPIYPAAMEREGVECVVIVEFVVDTNGRAINAIVVESIYSGFNASSIAAVEKWKFRPGMRAGRKVNTRMSVPINFQLAHKLN